ncbi:ExbD/TolR family protein [Paralcaligenes ureilyticus]|uniref:Biopolymer transport protein ExbD n=1 Tax=Paralcaligenes ureilyticus TaxID=627131 RepID=A0A4R3LXK0_9BURK|nr:biopolymer transporter ExbD [Paralcaligenes ureilyticus]TCT04509.1 biopolymer transport protein ExbD [Paralcaligenes ureilyticus]
MNFRQPQPGDEPEINLIPLIDVLLVILIFLAATTSFTRLSQLKVDLPQAQANAVDTGAIHIAVSQEGLYALDGQLLSSHDTDAIAQALLAAAQGKKDPVLVINADAQSTHESVVRVMEAARLAHIRRVNFATRSIP